MSLYRRFVGCSLAGWGSRGAGVRRRGGPVARGGQYGRVTIRNRSLWPFPSSRVGHGVKVAGRPGLQGVRASPLAPADEPRAAVSGASATAGGERPDCVSKCGDPSGAISGARQDPALGMTDCDSGEGQVRGLGMTGLLRSWLRVPGWEVDRWRSTALDGETDGWPRGEGGGPAPPVRCPDRRSRHDSTRRCRPPLAGASPLRLP